ncbi:hypothetical protein [Polaromonas glacialis]|uniref:hypothetical protein n=1 Tax=Polaromonas glacialis TaxID=866564 RepID=UPI001E558D48|nr:hypothetical protein [Polaromonas glacialis]
MKPKIVIHLLQKKHFVVLLGDLKTVIRRLTWIFPGGTHSHGFVARHQACKPRRICRRSLHATLLLAFGLDK